MFYTYQHLLQKRKGNCIMSPNGDTPNNRSQWFYDFVNNVEPAQPCHVPQTLRLLIEMEYTWLIYTILMDKFAMSKKYKPQIPPSMQYKIAIVRM